MGKEQGERNPLKRFFKKTGGETPQESHIIYEIQSNSSYDQSLVMAVGIAMNHADFSLSIGVAGRKVTVTSYNSDEREREIESVLFLGLTEATRRRLEPPADGYGMQAANIAEGLLTELTSKPKLYEAFKKYFGGLRWHLDQEKFVQELFIHGTDFDMDFLDENLTGHNLDTLVYILDMSEEITYGMRGGWSKMTPEEIFAQGFHDLDYRKLNDEEYLKVKGVAEIKAGYQQLIGDMLAIQNKRGLEKNITKDGREIPRPLVPLSKHPIIEALVVDELSVDRPKPKYDFSPSALTETVLDSDSKIAHEALVTAIITRLPKDQRRVFDGPDEFDHKHRNIGSILYFYTESYSDDQRRDLLRTDLARILDAFTKQGEIAESVRKENIAWRESTENWSGGAHDSTDVYKLKDIVKDLIEVGLTSQDPEIISRVEDLVTQYVPNKDNELAKFDKLALSRTDLMLVILDALKEITAVSQPAFFEKMGTRIFGNTSIGQEIRGLAQARIHSIEMRNTPEVLLALKEVRKYGISLKDERSTEEKEARIGLEDLVRPADQLMTDERRAKNDLLIFLLNQLSNSGLLAKGGDAAILFKGLVDRVEFSDYHMRKLPQEYQSLIELANNPNVTEKQRNDILWRIQNRFEYIESEAAHLLIPVVLDMYRIALGPVNNVRLPSSDTYSGLGAITSIVGSHKGMFKEASQAQLQILAQYEEGIRNHAERVATGAMLENEELNADLVGLQDWQKNTLENLAHAMRELKQVAIYYEQFLHIEAVKINANVYYPWVLQEFVPFWQGMQWEVGPGNQPTPEISQLFKALETLVKRGLVIRKEDQYSENFDVLKEGKLDVLLLECYQRMIPRHDIQYNSTDWQKGIPFLHQAVSYMPEVVLQQIVAKYPNTNFAEFLVKEHERFNKKEDIH